MPNLRNAFPRIFPTFIFLQYFPVKNRAALFGQVENVAPLPGFGAIEKVEFLTCFIPLILFVIPLVFRDEYQD